MRRLMLLATTFVLLQNTVISAEIPQPVFYLPLDRSLDAAKAGGDRIGQSVSAVDMILTLLARNQSAFLPGKTGAAYNIENSPISFESKGNFNPAEGTVSLWVRPYFPGNNKTLYCCFFGVDGWGMVYKYLNQPYITFAVYNRKKNFADYNCTADITAWKAGKWHQIAFSWSRRNARRKLYLDGKLLNTSMFTYAPDIKNRSMRIGCGCDKYKSKIAHAALDEVAIWNQALDDSQVNTIFRRGMAGKALVVSAMKHGNRKPQPENIIATVIAPTKPETVKPAQTTTTRSSISLNGRWRFQPMRTTAGVPDPSGWGWCTVPGHFTHDHDLVTKPDGKPAKRAWHGRSLSAYTVAWYTRSVVVPKSWRNKQILLRFGGISGMADIYVNGKTVGTLLPWEDEDYRIGDIAHFGAKNTITLKLTCMGKDNASGIYDNISIMAVPNSFVRDIAVRTRVAEQLISFSCDIANYDLTGKARIEFCVVPAEKSGGNPKIFTYDFMLTPQPRKNRALCGSMQRVDCSFAWSNAHLWTYDDPFQYKVSARLLVDGKPVDQTVPYGFGFRDFSVKGSSFYLNNVKTHLRGHQHSLTDNAGRKLHDYYAAGMNCIELLGPISHTISSGKPYKLNRYVQALDFADKHGMIAIPVLYGALSLQGKIFSKDVAPLYARRLDKHIRRFGNHPSICMWFMHFNGTGYKWYHPPTNADGSYTPADGRFKTSGPAFLEAERIFHELDWRPLFHHACGNLGSMYTLNCYIGPTCPLQEREEWPACWAAKKRKPLLAVEHGQMLIPYWYRARAFPLSIPYSSEPIFDEICAMYLGRRAYAYITPGVFQHYNLRKGYGFRTRIKKLIWNHGGYQEVKSLFTKYSLRSWRAYDINAIIYNAIQWDFRDAAGKALPELMAHKRFFSAIDFFVAGPRGDFPSKDHAFFSGERISKQVVLLNDLTHDVRDILTWRLLDQSGTLISTGRLRANFTAGTPKFIRLDLRAPRVRTRKNFVLRVCSAAFPDKRDTFALQVFPRPALPGIRSPVFLYDLAGDTGRLLRKTGIRWQPLTPDSRLPGNALIIVGCRSFGRQFLALADKIGLENAMERGANLLMFEQGVVADEFSATRPIRKIMGLRLGEQSTRRLFPAAPGHALLAGLQPEDFINLRGRSSKIPAYPLADISTRNKWPERYFKWGNRGVAATFVFTKPHYAPFRPVLECGFDLTGSPLLEARVGAGRMVLCQVDVTPRYSTDPVSTILVHNLLRELDRHAHRAAPGCVTVGNNARRFLDRFGIDFTRTAGKNAAAPGQVIVIGKSNLSADEFAHIKLAVAGGATALFLPSAARNPGLELTLKPTEFFIARLRRSRLFAGLGDGDTFLKQNLRMLLACSGKGWKLAAKPGIVATKKHGLGRFVVCMLDPGQLKNTRGQVKIERFWNLLLYNLGIRRKGWDFFGAQERRPCYHENKWERIPPYINW